MLPWAPGADGCDLLVDDGGDATLPIHKGKMFEERHAKGNAELKGIRQLLKDSIPSGLDHALSDCEGSLHMPTQTGVLLVTLAAMGAKGRWCSCNLLLLSVLMTKPLQASLAGLHRDSLFHERA